MKIYRTPHVVIFANFLPDKTKMSADRWDIHTLNPQLHVPPVATVSGVRKQKQHKTFDELRPQVGGIRRWTLIDEGVYGYRFNDAGDVIFTPDRDPMEYDLFEQTLAEDRLADAQVQRGIQRRLFMPDSDSDTESLPDILAPPRVRRRLDFDNALN